MILQIQRSDRTSYVDGITSINVHHKEFKIKKGSDHSKTDFYLFDKTEVIRCDDINTNGRRLRLFKCYDDIKKRDWFVITDCVCYLLNDEGKTVIRYAANTLE